MIPQISQAPGVVQLVLNFLQVLEQQGFTGDTATSYADRLTMATDNSVYQLLPDAVIFPRSTADVALLGDRTAIGLGVRLQQLTVLRFFAPVLLTSASVSCVGSLGFVGLMAPHMARFVLRGGQVSLLCGSALIGALLVLATDTLGRLAFAPLQIPAGIVIALVGCPFFVVLLWRRRDAL